MNSQGTEMSCQDLAELVTEYVEGTMPNRVRRRLESHVARCDGCECYLAQMRETARLLGCLPSDTLSDDALYRLLATFRAWKARGQGSAAAGRRS